MLVHFLVHEGNAPISNALLIIVSLHIPISGMHKLIVHNAIFSGLPDLLVWYVVAPTNARDPFQALQFTPIQPLFWAHLQVSSFASIKQC